MAIAERQHLLTEAEKFVKLKTKLRINSPNRMNDNSSIQFLLICNEYISTPITGSVLNCANSCG